MPGHGGRIVAEDGLPAVVALPKADALPPAQVDRRPDFHGRCVSCRSPRQNGKTRNMTHSPAICKGRAAAGRSGLPSRTSRRGLSPCQVRSGRTDLPRLGIPPERDYDGPRNSPLPRRMTWAYNSKSCAVGEGSGVTVRGSKPPSPPAPLPFVGSATALSRQWERGVALHGHQSGAKRPGAFGPFLQRGQRALDRLPARHLPAGVLCQPHEPPRRDRALVVVAAGGADADPAGGRQGLLDHRPHPPLHGHTTVQRDPDRPHGDQGPPEPGRHDDSRDRAARIR